MLSELREAVLAANLALVRHQLVTFTWGNASAIDRTSERVVIKPSGVPYDELTTESMVIVNLVGNIVEGDYRPSSDTPTHLEIYRSFPEIQSVVHTHSPWATVWSQACKSIPPFGTTHADYFFGEIPCTREMTPNEINSDYELNTAKVIVDTFRNRNPLEVPGVLVASHGPFCWGTDAENSVHNAAVLEEVAKMAYHTVQLHPQAAPISMPLLSKHFERKHGIHAYYGQT